jgi:MFS family permease
MITYVIVSGLAMPHLARVVRSTALARQLMALLGFAGAAVLLVVSYYLKDPLLAMLAMGSASFCNDLTMPGSWSTCMDVGGDYAGTLSGSMNMMGSVGAAVAPLVIGIILDCSNRNWALIFWISGSIYFLGGLCWLWIDPTTPLETNEDQQRFGDVEHVMDEVFVVLVDGAGKIHHVATPRI